MHLTLDTPNQVKRDGFFGRTEVNKSFAQIWAAKYPAFLGPENSEIQ